MHQNPRPRSVVLHELPDSDLPQPPVDPREQVVFVTNAVRRRGSLRNRADQRRPVLAAVVVT